MRWRPDDALASVNLREVTTDDQDEELCTDGTVRVHRVKESSEVTDSGIIYYRCGGGRRVVRKQIGGD